MKNNIFIEFLKVLKIPFNKRYAISLYNKQPYSNSLYGISILLLKYSIPNKCLFFKDKKNINNFCPFIINYDNRFIILEKIRNEKYYLIFGNGNRDVVNKIDFENNWDGNCLIAFPDKDSKEPDFFSHKKKISLDNIRSSIAIILILLSLIIGLWHNASKNNSAFLINMILYTLGLLISFLLIQKKILINNKFTNKLCGIIKNNNCDISISKNLLFIDLEDLSELGFAYFLANFIIMVYFPITIEILYIISYLIAFVGMFSIGYQIYKKKWCVLCLCISFILLSQALINIFLIGAPLVLNLYFFKLLFIIASLYYLCYFFVLNIVKLYNYKKSSLYWEMNYSYLKYNSIIMDSIKLKSHKVNVMNSNSLIFGDEKAAFEITVFSNPYCEPCAKMHRILDSIGKTKNIKIHYILTYFDDSLSMINKLIIATYRQFGSKNCWGILTEWYKKGKSNGECFFQDYHLEIDEEIERIFLKQQKWGEFYKLTLTPTVFINGYQLEEPYNLEDCIYFI